MEFRSELTETEWHFCGNCSKLPTDKFDVIVLPNLPHDLKLCEGCVALHDRGECRPSDTA